MQPPQIMRWFSFYVRELDIAQIHLGFEFAGVGRFSLNYPKS